MALRVVSAILFSPRGGSASAARALALGLREQGCAVTLLAGSRSDLGGHGNAHSFYGEVHAVSFDLALASGAPLQFDGRDGHAPLHPSYEDRPGAPDKVFAMLDDRDYERQVDAWSRELVLGGAREADVLHLHHLTPINEAAARVAPDVPVVGQIHGTELLMLERIAAGPPAGWLHAQRWATRIRGWADRCACLLVAPSGVERAIRVLGVPRGRVVALPNGVDVDLFDPPGIDRHAFWRDALVERPRGWLPGRPAGSARYDASAVDRLVDGVALLYVGRFTAVKRLDRLIGAFAQAQEHFTQPTTLILVGGHPGEWEGAHPAETIASLGVRNVCLVGWQAQERLPSFFAAAEALVLTSEHEQFGQVLIEAMACGVPPVATRSSGPTAIIDDGRTGWLVGADDQAELVAALVEVVNDPIERQRRGQAARQAVRERFSWTTIAEHLNTVLEDVVATMTPRRRPQPDDAARHRDPEDARVSLDAPLPRGSDSAHQPDSADTLFRPGLDAASDPARLHPRQRTSAGSGLRHSGAAAATGESGTTITSDRRSPLMAKKTA